MPELPVVPGEIIGWRAWRVETAGRREPVLISLYRRFEWPTRDWAVAVPLIADGGHGICAALDRDHLEEMHRWGSTNAARYVEDGSAIGKVALAGEIIEGERGYRADSARVVSIILPYAGWELLEGLRNAYRVPVSLGNILQRGVVSWT
jgi:hypothetical protein